MSARRYLAAFGLAGLGKGLLLPVLSLLLLSRGLDAGTLALATGAFALTVVLLELPSGMASDRWGRRRVYLVAHTIGAAGDLVLAFTGQAFGGMMLLGAAAAFESGSLSSLFFQRWIDARGKETLPRAASWMNLLETGGLAVGALAGGAVGAAAPAFLLPYAPLLLARFALRLGALAAAAGIPADPPLPHAARRRPDGWRRMASNRPLILLLAGGVVLGAALGNLETYWQPHLEQLAGGYTPLLGVMSCISMFGAAAGMAVIGRFAARLRLERVYAVSYLAVAGWLAALGHMTILWGYVGGFGALYLCMGGGDLARTSMLQAAIPPAQRATVMSVDGLLCRLGALLGSGVAAVALRHVGVPALWTGLGLMLAAGIGVQLLCGVTRTAGLSVKK